MLYEKNVFTPFACRFIYVQFDFGHPMSHGFVQYGREWEVCVCVSHNSCACIVLLLQHVSGCFACMCVSVLGDACALVFPMVVQFWEALVPMRMRDEFRSSGRWVKMCKRFQLTHQPALASVDNVLLLAWCGCVFLFINCLLLRCSMCMLSFLCAVGIFWQVFNI